MKPNKLSLTAFLVSFLVLGAAQLAIQPPAMATNSGLVVITEIMYHPAGGGQELEFIEIHNASPAPVDISGWYFSRGISYTFAPRTFLSGGEYAVVCANAERVAEV
ncbi:MAG: lamin tail domain-containing protein, partial [Planctomycetota bacterium]|nr:lamin tail domain-containing protein [Planctomycetota bacterium]